MSINQARDAADKLVAGTRYTVLQRPGRFFNGLFWSFTAHTEKEMTRMHKRSLLIPISWLIALTSMFATGSENAQLQKPLPHVLIIGDSISIGYTPYVAEILKDEAIVSHHKGNARHTGTGMKMLDQWVGTTKWDVIHFNWGLHDLCYRDPDSSARDNRDKIRGTISTNLEQYERNLDQLVQRLKKNGATLIWAQTTVVPEGETGRFVGDDRKYNEVAARVMKKYDIMIDDLYTLTEGFSPDLFVKSGDVHYTNDGYRKIAAQVAEKIRSALKSESLH
jgi:hypothetical protein